MNKKWKFGIIISALGLFILWLLNPSEGKFIRYIKTTKPLILPQKYKEIVWRDLAISNIKTLVEKGDLNYDIENRILYKYKNYFFFSNCTYVDDQDSTYPEVWYFYFGVFDKFISVGSDYPFGSK
jgi:hypothetical protein